MKRFPQFFLTALLLIPAAAASGAERRNTDDRYEYDKLVTTIVKPSAPRVEDDCIIFTAEKGPRFVGIAFDFENYRTVHPFQIRSTRDIDGAVTDSVLFYLLERPPELSEIAYRLVIDGLWTADPLNPDKEYDYKTGIELSKVVFSSALPPVTQRTDGGVHFIYEGPQGKSVRLAGSFTNWDSWIYALKETAPGFYELTLPLPAGRYYYCYYVGMNSFIDKTNPLRAYTKDGRTASVIEVK